MKCPYRKEKSIYKDVITGTTIREYYMDCYEEECPFFRLDRRRSRTNICLRPYGGDGDE